MTAHVHNDINLISSTRLMLMIFAATKSCRNFAEITLRARMEKTERKYY
jgi:hypothetical protein